MELKNDLIAVRFQDKYMTPPLLALWERIGEEDNRKRRVDCP